MHRYAHNESATGRILCLSMKVSIFAILCILGTFIVGQVRAQSYRNFDDIIFPGSDSRRLRNNPADRTPAPHSDATDDNTMIPIDLAHRLNSIETSNEFLQMLQGVPYTGESTPLLSRFGGDEKSKALIPAPAKCMPELQSVSLKVDDDPSVIIFPSCTRIKRCGGCCSSTLLSCQPTVIETHNFEVIVASVKDLNYKSHRIVPLDEHIKCKCDCRIKQEDCTDKQHYEPHNCQCACSNVDEEQKCRRNNDIKVWKTESCSCACRSIEQCSTGFYFNHNTCRCGPINRPVHSFAPSNYNFDNRQPENVPPVIIPLDPANPRRKHKEGPESRDTMCCP